MANDNEADDGAEEEQEEEEQARTSPLDDAEFLAEQYHEGGEEGEGLTQEQIGQLDVVQEHHDGPVTSSTVSHYMRKHDVDTRANTVDDERLDDPEWLAKEYLGEDEHEDGEGEKRTMQDIADEIGCSDGTVMRRLHEHDIPVRRSSVGESEDDEEAEDADSDEEEAEEPEDDEEGGDEE